MSINNKNDINNSKHPLSENISLISSSITEFEPVQKNGRLFKFILMSAKVEIKFNSLIKLIYNTSLYEIILWIITFLLFISNPKDMYYTWILIVHILKAILGLFLLNKIPKTFEIIENVAKNPNFEENKIIDLIKKEIKDSFIIKWGENKIKFLAYLIITIICFGIDFILSITQIIEIGKNEWLLRQACMLLFLIIFCIMDVIYFIWFATLKFSLPEDIILNGKHYACFISSRIINDGGRYENKISQDIAKILLKHGHEYFEAEYQNLRGKILDIEYEIERI